MVDIIKELQDYNVNVQVCDPEADPAEAMHEYGITLIPMADLKPASAVVLAVAHNSFCKISAQELLKLMNTNPVLIDVKSVFSFDVMKTSGISVWRL